MDAFTKEFSEFTNKFFVFEAYVKSAVNTASLSASRSDIMAAAFVTLISDKLQSLGNSYEFSLIRPRQVLDSLLDILDSVLEAKNANAQSPWFAEKTYSNVVKTYEIIRDAYFKLNDIYFNEL